MMARSAATTPARPSAMARAITRAGVQLPLVTSGRSIRNRARMPAPATAVSRPWATRRSGALGLPGDPDLLGRADGLHTVSIGPAMPAGTSSTASPEAEIGAGRRLVLVGRDAGQDGPVAEPRRSSLRSRLGLGEALHDVGRLERLVVARADEAVAAAERDRLAAHRLRELGGTVPLRRHLARDQR